MSLPSTKACNIPRAFRYFISCLARAWVCLWLTRRIVFDGSCLLQEYWQKVHAQVRPNVVVSVSVAVGLCVRVFSCATLPATCLHW